MCNSFMHLLYVLQYIFHTNSVNSYYANPENQISDFLVLDGLCKALDLRLEVSK